MTSIPAASSTPRNRTEPSPAASGSTPPVRTRSARSSRAQGERAPAPFASCLVQGCEHLAALASMTASAEVRRRRSRPAERAERRHRAQPQAARVRQRPGGRDPDPQAGERARPHPTAIASRSPYPSPARAITVGHRGHQLARVRRAARQARRAGHDLEDLAVGAQDAGGARRGRGVDAEQAHETVDAPAVAAQVLDPHPRGDPLEGRLRRRGPLDEADPVRRQVVVEQRGILAGERAQAVQVEVRHLGSPPASTCPIVKVGLVTGPRPPAPGRRRARRSSCRCPARRSRAPRRRERAGAAKSAPLRPAARRSRSAREGLDVVNFALAPLAGR